MLAITRRNEEKIYLTHPDGRIEVVLIEARPYRAMIGILAPASVTIWRAELGETPKTPQQGEQAIPETFYKADRERAKAGLSPFQLAYVERLEKAVRAADLYEQAMRSSVHSPRQYAAEMNLNLAMNTVNFLSESDEPELEPGDLPRDVIFG